MKQMSEYKNVFSFGGVQSHAALALTARGDLDFDAFIFANTGERAENPATLAYLRDVTIPFCEAYDIPFHIIQRTRRAGNERLGLKKGDIEDLYDQITRTGTRSIQIPVRMGNGAPGNRNCTQTFKIEVIDRFLKEHSGASVENVIKVGVGITTDEIGRMRTDQPNESQHRYYPLIDLRLTRQGCQEINEASGFHNVPRSACWFCPMKKDREWVEMSQQQPEVFAKMGPLERFLNEKRAAMGRDDVFFTWRCLPIEELIKHPALADTANAGEACDSGHCLT